MKDIPGQRLLGAAVKTPDRIRQHYFRAVQLAPEDLATPGLRYTG